MRNGPAPAPASAFGLSPKKATPALSHSTSFSSLNQVGGTSARSGAAEGEGGGATVETSSDYAVGLLSALPASDHALAYVVLDTGVSGLFVTFRVPGCCVANVVSFSPSFLFHFCLLWLQMILVALATFDSELYVTFPGTVST